jgi:hypothetical protein
MSNSIHAQKSIMIDMEDGSTIEGVITLDLETIRDNSVADQQLWDFTPGAPLQVVASLLEQMLTDNPGEEDIEIEDPEDSIGMGYGGSDFDPGEHPIHDSDG